MITGILNSIAITSGRQIDKWLSKNKVYGITSATSIVGVTDFMPFCIIGFCAIAGSLNRNIARINRVAIPIMIIVPHNSKLLYTCRDLHIGCNLHLKHGKNGSNNHDYNEE